MIVLNLFSNFIKNIKENTPEIINCIWRNTIKTGKNIAIGASIITLLILWAASIIGTLMLISYAIKGTPITWYLIVSPFIAFIGAVVLSIVNEGDDCY